MNLYSVKFEHKEVYTIEIKANDGFGAVEAAKKYNEDKVLGVTLLKEGENS